MANNIHRLMQYPANRDHRLAAILSNPEQDEMASTASNMKGIGA